MSSRAPLSSIGNTRMSLARMSMGVGSGGPGARRCSVAPPRQSVSRRGSVADPDARRKSSMRKSSVAGGRRSSKNADTRPVKDKGYMQQCAEVISQFLTETGWEGDTHNLHKAPAVKTYAAMIEHCWRQVEPNFTLAGKPDEAIPIFFKRLMYPFTIKGSELLVIPQNRYGPLLAALRWLVDLLNYEGMLSQEKEAMPLVDAEDAEGIFFDYLSRAYGLFMAGQDATSQLDTELQAQFDEKNEDISNEIASLKRSNDTLEREMQKLRASSEKLEAMHKQKASYENDLVKFSDLIDQFKEYIGKIERKLASNKRDLEAKREQLAMLTTERERAAQTLKEQEEAAVDYRALAAQKESLSEELALVRKEREMHLKIVGEAEIGLNRQLEVVESLIHTYTERSMRLRLLPSPSNPHIPATFPGTQRQTPSSYDIQLKSHAAPDQMMNLNLAQDISPALALLRDSMMAETAQREQQAMQYVGKLEALAEDTESVRSDIASAERQLASKEASVRAEKEVMEEELTLLRATVSECLGEAESTKERMAQRTSASLSALDTLRGEESRLKKDMALQAQAVNASLIRVVGELTNHKQYVQQQLRKLRAHAERVRLTATEERANMTANASLANVSFSTAQRQPPTNP